jgi:6,7-dimethyl-8-ribityllumazine synthase
MNQIVRKTDVQGGAGRSDRIAFIKACWHENIVDQCRISFLTELARLGTGADVVDVIEVPGSFEIPLQAKLLARTGRFEAIVASGFVVDGGIYRHEFVARAVIDALMRVQIETEVPVISAVLTPRHYHEHEDHRRFFFEHFAVKGIEAAQACVRTIANVREAKRLLLSI